MMPSKSLPFVLLCASLIIACDKREQPETTNFDHEANSLSFATPKFNPPDSLSYTPPLADDARLTLLLQQAFFAKAFGGLDKALNESHENYVNGQGQNDIAKKFFDQIATTQLAGIDSCKGWVSAMPSSYAAHWACGTLWSEGA